MGSIFNAVFVSVWLLPKQSETILSHQWQCKSIAPINSEKKLDTHQCIFGLRALPSPREKHHALSRYTSKSRVHSLNQFEVVINEINNPQFFIYSLFPRHKALYANNMPMHLCFGYLFVRIILKVSDLNLLTHSYSAVVSVVHHWKIHPIELCGVRIQRSYERVVEFRKKR